MSKFFVGQRVRLVMPYGGPAMMGAEGRIIEICNVLGRLPGGGKSIADCKVDFGIRKSLAHFDQLEPILPEGAAPSQFTFQQLMDELKRIEA